MNAIPLLDLRAQHDTIREKVRAAVDRVVDRQGFIMGDEVREIEAQVAALSGAAHGIACASGTDALLLSLKALDMVPGDEVVTSPFTFFATAGAIHNAGGTPVFVDIRRDDFNIDPGLAAAAVTDRTRAMIPVHLFGQMAAVDELLPVASARDLWIIEDAAQAIGARRLIDGVWRSAGELGKTGAFSFFPSKNLGGWGDGGMIVTQDEALAARLRSLRTHGGARKYFHDEIGLNSRLDTLQAAVLLVKMDFLDGWSAARRARAAFYDECLGGIPGIVTPGVDPANEHIYHQYTVRAQRRDDLAEYLKGKGIGVAVYYPKPLHLQPCFASLGYREGQLPESELASREVLSLPVYPELSEGQQLSVCEAIRSFYR